VCEGATTTLSDATSGGTWSSGATSIATVTSGGVVTGVAGGIATISYTITSACGSASATRDVTVNPLPVAGSIGGTPIVCEGASTTLVDFAPGGVWSSVPTTVATVGTSGVVTGVMAGLATVSYTVTNGCGTAAVSAVVTVNPAPNAGVITGVDSLCPGTTTSLSDAVTGGVWSSGDTTLATVSGSGVVAGVTSGIVPISYAFTNGCGTAYATMTVTVIPLPSAGSITGSASVCVGATAALGATIAGGSWSTTNGNVTVGSSTGVVTGVTQGLDTLLYTVTNFCGTATIQRGITINDVPPVSPVAGPTSVCVGATISLTDASPSGVWTRSNPAANVSSGGVVTGVSAGLVTISYTVSNSCGPHSALYTVNVMTVPTAGIISGAVAICPDSVEAMTASIPGGVWSVRTGNALIDVTGMTGGYLPGLDTVVYTVTNPCGTAYAEYPIEILPYSVCDPAGVGTIGMDVSALTIHPNPNGGTFTMTLTSSLNEQVEVTVTNVLGETITSLTTTTNKATDVRLNVAPGIYMISAKTPSSKYTARIVIAK